MREKDRSCVFIVGRDNMPSIITTISLDDESKKIAETLPNLSHFVREALYRYASNLQVQECTRETWQRGSNHERCNPFQQPVCFSCWPHGAPPSNAVAQWANDNLSIKWLDDQARDHNKNLYDLTNINTLEPKIRDKVKKLGFFAKLRENIRNRSP